MRSDSAGSGHARRLGLLPTATGNQKHVTADTLDIQRDFNIYLSSLFFTDPIQTVPPMCVLSVLSITVSVDAMQVVKCRWRVQQY